MPSQTARRIAILSVILIFFEVFLGRVLEFYSVRPDLFLIYIVFWAFVIDRRSAPQIAIVLGLLRDVFSTGFFGAETLSYFIVGLLVSMLSLKVERANFLIHGITCFLFSLAHFWIYAVLILVMNGSSGIPGNFWWITLFDSLYTALMAAWMIGFFERLIYFRTSRSNLFA